MKYATFSDVQARINIPDSKQIECEALLDDAAVIIDAYNTNATLDSKKLVSIRMVIRAIGNSEMSVPIGASQGSMSALGYSQSWTMSTTGSAGELYLSRLDKKMLGVGDKIGSHSPLEDM